MPRVRPTSQSGDELSSELYDVPDVTNAKARARALRANQARQASGRQRLVDPTTCDRDYSGAEMEFLKAIQEYKQRKGRQHPTWSEILEILRSLGYEKPPRDEML